MRGYFAPRIKIRARATAASAVNAVKMRTRATAATAMNAVRTRTIWTFILIFLFALIIAAGHFYCSILVLVVTHGVYSEIISLKRNREKDKRLPLFFFLHWYWWVVTIFVAASWWLVPMLESRDMLRPLPAGKVIYRFKAYSSVVMFGGIFLGFVLFVLSLRRFSLKYQFAQFSVTIICCLFVVIQSVIQIATIYSGLVWFFLPSSLVICNDCFAYIYGTIFGRTPLIKLSPNKTVEGFVGASVVTVFFAVLAASILQEIPVFMCEPLEFNVMPFKMWTQGRCTINTTYDWINTSLPHWIKALTGFDTFSYTALQMHSLIFGLFAAFAAPFGGFFASGVKRAVGIKNFGDSIPGHGGLTDRFDCQIVMGAFTYLYLKSVLRQTNFMTYILRMVHNLTLEDQIVLFHVLRGILISKQIDHVGLNTIDTQAMDNKLNNETMLALGHSAANNLAWRLDEL